MGSCPDTDIDPVFPNGLRKLCGVCLIVKLCFIVDYIPRGKIWISVSSKNKRFTLASVFCLNTTNLFALP